MILRFEKTDENTKGKRCISNSLPWINNEASLSLDKKENNVVNSIKNVWLDKNNLKIVAPEGYYLKVPNIEGVFNTFMYDDNFENKEMIIYLDKPNELFINLNSAKKTKYKSSSIYNCYVIDVIRNNELEIYRYFIFVFLHYKNNGKIANPKGTIDIEIVSHQIFRKEIAYEVIDHVALGYLLWCLLIMILSIFKVIKTNKIIEEPMVFVVFVSYLFYITVKSRYVGNTWINRFYKFFMEKTKKRKKDYYSMRDVHKEIKKMSNFQDKS